MIHLPFACVFRRYPRGMNCCYSQAIVGRLLPSYSSANPEFAKRIVATTDKKRCKFQEVPNTFPKNPGAAYLLSWSKIKCIYSLYTKNTCLLYIYIETYIAGIGNFGVSSPKSCCCRWCWDGGSIGTNPSVWEPTVETALLGVLRRTCSERTWDMFVTLTSLGCMYL